jgi:hypothetical protein
MARIGLLGVVALLMMAGMASKTFGLDASESAALLSFYQSNYQGLNELPLPWGSDMSKACGDVSNPAWSGIGCSNDRAHILSLFLHGSALKGTIPNNIDGLTSLQTLRLSSCSLTGTVPASIGNMTTLNLLNLQGNKLSLCASGVPSRVPSNCLVSGQNTDACIDGCCGCNADWTNAGCASDVGACAACTGTAPTGAVSSGCSNGRWVIPGSFAGPLVIEGKVLIGGDYELRRGETIVFVGWDSQLNVTGKITMRGAVVMFVNDEQLKELKLIGINRKLVTYMTAGVTQTLAGASTGKSVLFSAHTRRACQRPSATLSGDSATYSASLRWINACNTWWIILLCMSPTIIGFFFAIFINLV